MVAEHEFLKALYAAFNARDLEAALAGMHVDVVWANGMDGGTVQGRNAVRGYWTRQWRLIDPRVEPQRFTDENGGTLVEVHQVVRDLEGGLVADQMVRHHFRFEKGLVKTFEIR
ncbi:MAG TPA: nuclear transport factor 2 family protein [Chthoniobacterales bacterium]